MNRKLWIPLMVLGLCLICMEASANSWGLTGELYQAVEQSKAWEDYSTLGNQAGPFAVMKARYHQALFYVDEAKELHVYTTAVYQPEAKREAPRLTYAGDLLTIQYGETEAYRFSRFAYEDGRTEFQLNSAVFGDFSLSVETQGEFGASWQYVARESGASNALAFPVRILLSDFNIELFPHSLEEVRHLNWMLARFDSGLDCLGTAFGTGDVYSPDAPGELLQPGKKGTAPVYSAPYGKSAWRAAKGKAAVGLNGDLWILSQYRNADGASYACIRYDVSERTQRIGYVLCRDLGLEEIAVQENEPGSSFVHIDVETTADTWLTDDPDVSQFAQFTVPRGTQFDCLGLYDHDYAYVTAEVRNGRFVDGGAIVWGFIPIRDLKPMDGEIEEEAMEQLAGDWVLEAGGSLAPEILHFHADGIFTTGNAPLEEGEDTVIEGAQSGTWSITKYSPFMNLYWNQPQYEITLLFENGRAMVCGLEMTEDGFSLTNWEGGGGYVPFEPDGTEHEEDEALGNG